MDSSRSVVHFRRPPLAWEQGLPVAAGNLGAMLYGCHRDHRVMLSHKKHWLPLIDRQLPDMSQYRGKMVELCQAGRFDEADAYWMACREKEGLAGFWWHDPNHPCAELQVIEDMGCAFQTRHELDCSTGEAQITWRSHSHEGTKGPVHSLSLRGLSRPQVVVLSWSAAAANQLHGGISLNALSLGHRRLMGGQRVQDYLDMREANDGTDLLVIGTYCNGKQFETRARVYADGKPIEPNEYGQCRFREASEIRALMVTSDPELGEPESQRLASQLDNVDRNFDAIVEKETHAFSSVYTRASIRLGCDAADAGGR